jgi:hypothetical protein
MCTLLLHRLPPHGPPAGLCIETPLRHSNRAGSGGELPSRANRLLLPLLRILYAILMTNTSRAQIFPGDILSGVTGLARARNPNPRRNSSGGCPPEENSSARIQSTQNAARSYAIQHTASVVLRCLRYSTLTECPQSSYNSEVSTGCSSVVECSSGGRDVAGSNPVTPIRGRFTRQMEVQTADLNP